MIKIIVDSTTDLPKEIISKYNIDMLPLRINMNGNEYLDKTTIHVNDVYNYMKEGNCPKTSLPNISQMIEMLSNYASIGQDFIFYSFSSKMSGTYQALHFVIEDLKEKYPDVNMEVIDSKGGTVGTGLIVHQAAKLIEVGCEFEDVIRISRENISNIEYIFTLDDLHWLNKGGRISKCSEIVGSALSVKPIMYVDDGELKVDSKVRGRKKALRTMVQKVESIVEKFPNQIIGLAHVNDYESVIKIIEMLPKDLNRNNIIIEEIGSVLSSHLGFGGVGIFLLKEKPEVYINEL